MEITASINRMWIKNAVTWNMKKPPSHNKSKTNPIARNIVRLFLPKMFDAFRVCDPIWANGDVTTVSGAPAVGNNFFSPLTGPYFEKLGARKLRNVASGNRYDLFLVTDE